MPREKGTENSLSPRGKSYRRHWGILQAPVLDRTGQALGAEQDTVAGAQRKEGRCADTVEGITLGIRTPQESHP